MAIAPFLRRHFVLALRRGTVFADRRAGVIATVLVVTCFVIIWDWSGRDRSSIAGASRFALSTFACVVASQFVLTLGIVPSLVAPGIASERDRKSLDSLLATGYSATDIIVGKLTVGLLRYANFLGALAPVVTLMAFLGGIEPWLILLAVLALASTAISLASLSMVVSIHARTVARAVAMSVFYAWVWMCMPMLVVMLLPRFWPLGASWIVPIALRVMDSSPIGLLLSEAGVIPRGPLEFTVFRMIALQLSVSTGLVFWAIIRLRPASRAIYDADSPTRFRILRRRWRTRPACGDDPVLWHELYGGRSMSILEYWTDRLMTAFWMGLLIYLISWFALPAFAELLEYGYGPHVGRSAGHFSDVNPIARVLVGKLMSLVAEAAPGEARLELNHVLRITTGFLDYIYILMIAGAAAESVALERERDTWLGLIATPLSGREILRPKILGSIWKARRLIVLLLGLWVTGLLAGAVHPLGLIAELTCTGVTTWFVAVLGVSTSLWARDRGQATGRVISTATLFASLAAFPFIFQGKAGILLGGGTMPFQAWASLLSYEDVHAAIHKTRISRFLTLAIPNGEIAQLALIASIVSTIIQAVAAYLLMASAIRGFDAAVGRPVRSQRPDTDD